MFSIISKDYGKVKTIVSPDFKFELKHNHEFRGVKSVCVYIDGEPFGVISEKSAKEFCYILGDIIYGIFNKGLRIESQYVRDDTYVDSNSNLVLRVCEVIENPAEMLIRLDNSATAFNFVGHYAYINKDVDEEAKTAKEFHERQYKGRSGHYYDNIREQQDKVLESKIF